MLTFDNVGSVEIAHAILNEVHSNQYNVTVGDLNKGIVSHQGKADK